MMTVLKVQESAITGRRVPRDALDVVTMGAAPGEHRPHIHLICRYHNM